MARRPSARPNVRPAPSSRRPVQQRRTESIAAAREGSVAVQRRRVLRSGITNMGETGPVLLRPSTRTDRRKTAALRRATARQARRNRTYRAYAWERYAL